MPEPRDHPGLGQKPLGNGRVSGKLGMDDLDRDRPVQRQVAPSSRSSRYWPLRAAWRLDRRGLGIVVTPGFLADLVRVME
jgi:hypothetical protein